MVEIYSYDVTTHERFARDQQEVEAFRLQYHVPPSGTRLFAMQGTVLDFIPKHSAVSLLFQTFQRKTWSRFGIPKNFHNQRYLSSYVAPSMGSRERQDADIERIKAYIKQKTHGRIPLKEKKEEDQRRRQQSEEEEMVEEGELIIALLEKGVKETNEMVEYIIARMHQFIQA